MNPLLYRSIVALFRGFRHSRTNGIQVDIGHGSEEGMFVKQGLTLETSLPEMTGTFILGVGHAGDAFVEDPHKP